MEGPTPENTEMEGSQRERESELEAESEGPISNNTNTEGVFRQNLHSARQERQIANGEHSSDSSKSTLSSQSYSDADAAAANASRLIPMVTISHGYVSLIGRRRDMEDTVTVFPGFVSVSADAYDFFGVYDGHGGVTVAEACRDRMHLVLAEEVVRSPAVTGEVWREVMEKSFLKVDEEVAEVAAAAAVDGTVGSTAVVAVVGMKSIVVANCGDSRAVLSRGRVAIPLSFDHKPERPDELERVEAAGGRVINWNGYRVLGVLATSRSLGDYYLKPFVIAVPEVTITDRTDRDEFLILASDGLWDVVSNEVACRVARQCLTGRAAKKYPEAVNGRSAYVAATLLAKLAMSRGSRDNVSVVVVQLKKLGGKASP